MEAGKLDRRVTIERRGAPVDTGMTKKPGPWAYLADRAAEVIYSRGRETLANQGVEAELPVAFRVRFDSVTKTITVRDRLIYEGKPFDLKSVNEIGRRDGVELVGVASV